MARCARAGFFAAMLLLFAPRVVCAQTEHLTPQPGSSVIHNLDASVTNYADHATPLLSASKSEQGQPQDPMGNAAGAMPPISSVPASQPATSPSTQATPPKGEWLIVPLPIYKPELGWGIVGTAGYIFPLDPADSVSPPSTVAAMGYYSQNNSWAAGLMGKFFVDEDRYRITAGMFKGQVNYDFFGVGTDAGNQDRSIPISLGLTGGIFETLFRVGQGVYVGPRYLGGAVRVSSHSDETAVEIPVNELHTTTSGLGVHAQWDTRDSQFYPRRGHLLDADINFHGPAIGDDFNYQVYQISFNQYFTLSPRQVLAYRVMGQFENGDVPFYALSSLGRGSDIRGYPAGRYQDKQLVAAQAEYRLEITPRIGAVAFAGMGEVAPSISALRFDSILPAAGVGLRFVVAEKNHVAIRLDAAWGKDGGNFYLGIGEAF